jgi:glycosyltransferase involved in cell wall biosynthesis
MEIAQVYPHAVIPVPCVDLHDALAIVNFELARRLARTHTVVSYVKQGPGQRADENYEGVLYRRIPEGLDRALNAFKLLNRGLSAQRPFRLSPLYYAHFVRSVARDIRSRRCRVVHLHSVNNFIPVIRRLNKQAAIVLHMHDHSLADFDPAVVGARIAQADLILGCSDFVTDAIRRRFSPVADRCHTLYNGIDQRFLEIRSDPARSQRVLFVGRLCPEKGVHVLLDAMRRLPGRQAREVSLVGPLDVAPREFVDPFHRDPLFSGLAPFYARPADYQAWLERQAAAIGGHVSFHGPVHNRQIGPLYAEAGVFVFPSLWHEPFGIPVIEAMAAGLPVVATRSGALPEIVVDGETGLLVDRGDAEGLSAAIGRLLASPLLRARMGAAGRERARNLFTWDRCVARLNELYARVAAVSNQRINPVAAAPGR